MGDGEHGCGVDFRGYGGLVRGFWDWRWKRGAGCWDVGKMAHGSGRGVDVEVGLLNGRGEGSVGAREEVSSDRHPPEATYVHRYDNRKALGNFAQWVLLTRRRPIVCCAVGSVATDGSTGPSLDVVVDKNLHDNRINLITILHIKFCTFVWLSFFPMDL